MQAIEGMDQFFTLVREKDPTVMVFSADWCPDCRYMDTYIDEVVNEYQGKFRFYHVDRDKFLDLCETLDVLGIPSFIAYRDGQVVSRFVNGKRKTKQEVTDFLDDAWAKMQV
ncbi:thioredoxin family protein [Alicyclobacillus shizuokensis]|uniref:thioredoxin family protein n=1 Tax=Alicyclobacillus shizuokensis TaxID=392014 RepID=UPI00082FD9B0|nr:thioredoxin family protein [Alicyclobacillus shizuokensis]